MNVSVSVSKLKVMRGTHPHTHTEVLPCHCLCLSRSLSSRYARRAPWGTLQRQLPGVIQQALFIACVRACVVCGRPRHQRESVCARHSHKSQKCLDVALPRATAVLPWTSHLMCCATQVEECRGVHVRGRGRVVLAFESMTSQDKLCDKHSRCSRPLAHALTDHTHPRTAESRHDSMMLPVGRLATGDGDHEEEDEFEDSVDGLANGRLLIAPLCHGPPGRQSGHPVFYCTWVSVSPLHFAPSLTTCHLRRSMQRRASCLAMRKAVRLGARPGRILTGSSASSRSVWLSSSTDFRHSTAFVTTILNGSCSISYPHM